MPAKKKAVRRVKPKATRKEEPQVRAKKHADMLTIALRGEEAVEIMGFMAKHSMKGADLLRQGYQAVKAAKSRRKK